MKFGRIPRCSMLGFAAALLVSGGASAQAQKVGSDAWRQKAVKAVRAEPKVVEAMFPNDARNSFWASMRDDGTRRDGFAQYLCMSLFESGMPKGDFIVVRIWDARAMAQSQMREIGKFDCKRD
jgi:hypothetical protein